MFYLGIILEIIGFCSLFGIKVSRQRKDFIENINAQEEMVWATFVLHVKQNLKRYFWAESFAIGLVITGLILQLSNWDWEWYF